MTIEEALKLKEVFQLSLKIGELFKAALRDLQITP